MRRDIRRETCDSCGQEVEELPLTWTVETTTKGRFVLCDTCTREHLRSIEGKLSADWF